MKSFFKIMEWRFPVISYHINNLGSNLLVACVDTGGAIMLDCTDCGTVEITAVCWETGVITYLGVIWGGTGGAACG